MVTEKETMTSGQAAKILGIPARTLRRYLMTGKLRATQHPITGRWTIRREEVLAFLEKYRVSRPDAAQEPTT